MYSNQSLIFVIDITKSRDMLYLLAWDVVYSKLGIEIQIAPDLFHPTLGFHRLSMAFR